MKAVRIPVGRPLAPFGDAVGALPVLDVPLAQAPEAALSAAGLSLADAPPRGEPYVVFSDRTWFSPELLRRLVAAGPGRLRVDDADWHAVYEPLQELPAPGLYEIGVHPASATPPALDRFPELAPHAVDLGLEAFPAPRLHPALAHAATRPVKVSAAAVHQIDHWTHLLRANLLALGAGGLEAKLAFERLPWWRRLLTGLGLLARVRSREPARWMAALSRVAPTAKIHPTAVVELSEIKDGVEIGPYAVVRGSVVGEGVRIEEFASIHRSVVGAGGQVGRYGMINLCVMLPGAMVSAADGYQMSVFGRDAFMAWGAVALDLSFGKPVRVEQGGVRVDSGQHLLGVCVGHRARVGYGARMMYGAVVPNDAFLVAEAGAFLRTWGDAPVGGPVTVVDGRPVPVRR